MANRHPPNTRATHPFTRSAKKYEKKDGQVPVKEEKEKDKETDGKKPKKDKKNKAEKKPKDNKRKRGRDGNGSGSASSKLKKPSELFSPRILFDSHVGGIACKKEAIHISQSGYCWNANTFEQTCREPGIQMVDPG